MQERFPARPHGAPTPATALIASGFSHWSVSVSPSRARGLSLRSSYRLDICLQQRARSTLHEDVESSPFPRKQTKPRGLRQPAQVGWSQTGSEPGPLGAHGRRLAGRVHAARGGPAPRTPRRPGAALPAAPPPGGSPGPSSSEADPSTPEASRTPLWSDLLHRPLPRRPRAAPAEMRLPASGGRLSRARAPGRTPGGPRRCPRREDATAPNGLLSAGRFAAKPQVPKGSHLDGFCGLALCVCVCLVFFKPLL